MKKVYFDHSATTPVHPEVLEAMLPYLKEIYGNASSIHSFGREAKQALELAREKAAALINAEKVEILFTSGGTESDNWAIKGVAEANKLRGNHIITSAIEHHAVLETCEYLEKRGFEVTYLPVDEYGIVSPASLQQAMRDTTILVSVMHANNEIGTVQDIAALAAIAHEKNAYFHTDAVQTAGHLPIDVKGMGIDLLSVSGHKLNAPKGVGFLFVRKGVRLAAIQHGGSHERGKRAGTENIPGIVAMGKACEIAAAGMAAESERLIALRTKLIDGVFARIPDVRLNGHPEKRLPGSANFCFKYVEGESILLSLDMKCIGASSGSACTSGSLEPSHVLLAIGLPHEIAHGSLRITMGLGNTEEDVDYFLDTIPEIIERLRKMSPLYNRKECAVNV